jgi:uncharacterized protein YqeY
VNLKPAAPCAAGFLRGRLSIATRTRWTRQARSRIPNTTHPARHRRASHHGSTAMSLKQRLTDDMKTAMKAGEKERLGTIRLINAAIKQREVDERIQLDDAQVLAVLEKMVKQRKDSVTQYETAGREELAAIERAEIAVIEQYLPEKLGEAEILAAIEAAIAETGASGPADMGKLMGVLKPRLAGQADMGLVSKLIKTRLAG